MTRTLPQDRTRRARNLLVGVGSLPDELSTSDMPGELRVDNLFDAIGELTLSSARQPIDTIFIAESTLTGATAESIESLREIDPSVQLVLVRDGGGPSTQLGSLFDRTIASDTLSGEQPLAPDQAQPAEQTTAPVDEPNARPQTPPEPEPVTIEVAIEQPQPRPAPARRSLQDEPLGDVDLVNAIIHQDGRLLDRALRLITQQTGWADVRLHTTQTAIDGAAASVTYGSISFGTLVSAQADARSLKPWADWLGHWLALDEAHREHRLNSLRDDLTGAWNRRFFNEFLTASLKRARQLRVPVTVMVFDIDDFKIYNDTYGHEAGDEILIETVRLLESVIRQCDRVCRIGGDEFAVIFADLEGPRAAGSAHPDEVGDIATRFQKQVTAMSFPKLSNEAPGSLTISGGLSTFPWDGDDPEQLLRLADRRALRSKRAGKNVITFGPEADDAD